MSVNHNKGNNMIKLSLEDYKKQVEANLTQRVGKKESARLMALYEIDFPELFQKKLSIVATATALIMGY